MTTPTQLRRVSPLLFVLFAGVFTYFTLFGATFNGILTPDILNVSVILLTILIGVWRVERLVRRRVWHPTPFDILFLFWGLAIGASLVLNNLLPMGGSAGAWRRSAEAIWYWLFYVALWYLLCDLVLNKIVSRQLLVNALLFAGFILMLFGYYQIWFEYQRNFPFGFPRPVSFIGNANSFGNVLMVLLPFSLVGVWQARNFLARFIMVGYSGSVILLSGMARSRGALLAMMASLGIFALLMLAERGLLSPRALWGWFRERNRAIQSAIGVVLVAGIIGMIFATTFIIGTLSDRSRNISLRTYLWDAAIDMYLQQPLTGQGLYTYGRQLPLYDSIPNGQPQAHAHSLPLNIAAELGTIGLLVLGVSALVILVQWWRNWGMTSKRDKPLYIAASAALAGYAAHHLVDTPAMMPIIAMIGIVLLVVVIAPPNAEPMKLAFRRVGHPIGVTVMWVVLLGFAFWHVLLYSQYFTILEDVIENENYREAADALQPLIDADPHGRAYVLQQAYLYGLAAHDGDADALEKAIAGYEYYTQLEPTHAQGWSNLAGLYYQAGRRVDARIAIDSAIVYAATWSHFKRQRLIYANAILEAEDITPPEPNIHRNGANWSRFQYLREVLDDEYLPQAGYGNR